LENIAKLNAYKNKKYDEQDISEFLELLGYSEISVEKVGNYRRFDMKESGEDRTLYINCSANMIIESIQLLNYRVKKMKDNSWKLILGSVVAVGLVIWFVVALVSDFSNDEEEYNPYTEDFDGDGLHGDKDDHEILHNMDTMPTEPMDGEQ
jgi:hypothetical protein